MEDVLRFLLIVGLEQEVAEIVESEMVPAVPEIGGRSQGEHLLEIVVVFFIRLVGICDKAKPHSPLIDKKLTLKHRLYKLIRLPSRN
jgi:hypothetical protein